MHHTGCQGKHRSTVAAGRDEWLGAHIFAAFSFTSDVTLGATANGFCISESCSAKSSSRLNALVQFTLRRQSTLTQGAASIDDAQLGNEQHRPHPVPQDRERAVAHELEERLDVLAAFYPHEVLVVTLLGLVEVDRAINVHAL